jgi:hypothetical protein
VASRRTQTLALSFALIVTAYCGCSTKDDSAMKRETSHVRSLTNLLVMATAKLGHVPKNEQEFKQAIATLKVSPEKLKVGSIEELFVSERDGKPLVVVYGQPPKGSDVVVYEQVGVNGKRQVGHRIGMVEELDEAQCKGLIIATH